jgi:hypothetical protein
VGVGKGVETSGIGESGVFVRGGGVVKVLPFPVCWGLEIGIPSSGARQLMLDCICVIIAAICDCRCVMASIWFCIDPREAEVSTWCW